MRMRRFDWAGAADTAAAIRAWTTAEAQPIDIGPIEREVREHGDAALLELTARFDATERGQRPCVSRTPRSSRHLPPSTGACAIQSNSRSRTSAQSPPRRSPLGGAR